MKNVMLLTCEHAGNRVPPEFRKLFKGKSPLLRTHRGYDPGAKEIAERIAVELACDLMEHNVTRLLADVNRSATNPSVFSEVTRGLEHGQRETILKTYHEPHRAEVREKVRRLSRTARVCHLSIHSFTPVLDGKTRELDIGLLYDPARPEEAAFCRDLKHAIKLRNPGWRLYMNRPYKGVSDGLTTDLRRSFPGRYLGIEIEVNQGLLRLASRRRQIADVLIKALREPFPPVL